MHYKSKTPSRVLRVYMYKAFIVIYFYRSCSAIGMLGLGRVEYRKRYIGYRAPRPPICGRSFALNRVCWNYRRWEFRAPVNPWHERTGTLGRNAQSACQPCAKDNRLLPLHPLFCTISKIPEQMSARKRHEPEPRRIKFKRGKTRHTKRNYSIISINECMPVRYAEMR